MYNEGTATMLTKKWQMQGSTYLISPTKCYCKLDSDPTSMSTETVLCLPHVLQLCKGKAIPLQVWTGPKGSMRLRLPDFKTIGTWRW